MVVLLLLLFIYYLSAFLRSKIFIESRVREEKVFFFEENSCAKIFSTSQLFTFIWRELKKIYRKFFGLSKFYVSLNLPKLTKYFSNTFVHLIHQSKQWLWPV